MKCLNNTQNIELRKHINRLVKQSKTEAKPTHCILCQRPQSSFCNSHLIPQMVLKNIADNGKLLTPNAFMELEAYDIEKGVNNAGVFHFICRECDSTLFQNYENPSSLCELPTDKMMAEIAMKNVLLQLSKRNNEVSLYNILQEKHNAFLRKDILDEAHTLDIRDYMSQLEIYQDIIKTNTTGCFQILFWKRLSFVVPIAVQTPMVIYKDMNQDIINDVFDLSPNIRMQDLHLCIFPLENESVVLAFYHKRDKNYRSLHHQFNSSSEEKCLEFINYLVFEYSENYFLSKTIQDIVENTPSLKKICRETNGQPNFGELSIHDMHIPYVPITPDQIPNFLTESYKIE